MLLSSVSLKVQADKSLSCTSNRKKSSSSIWSITSTIMPQILWVGVVTIGTNFHWSECLHVWRWLWYIYYMYHIECNISDWLQSPRVCPLPLSAWNPHWQDVKMHGSCIFWEHDYTWEEGHMVLLCPDPTQLTWGEGVWCHKSKSLGPLQNHGAANQITEQRWLE